MSSRPAQYTEQVPGQPGLKGNFVLKNKQTNKKNQQQQKRKKEKRRRKKKKKEKEKEKKKNENIGFES